VLCFLCLIPLSGGFECIFFFWLLQSCATLSVTANVSALAVAALDFLPCAALSVKADVSALGIVGNIISFHFELTLVSANL
jgi:hypothetical protein